MLEKIGLGDLEQASAREKFTFFGVLFLTFFLFADQNVAAANLSRIGAEFGFTQEKDYRWYIGSLVSLCFFALGGLLSVYAGVLNDKFSAKGRLYTLILVSFMGELACAASGLAPNYAVYLATRTLTGVGLGGIYPLIFSAMGDYFRPANRPIASGYLGLAMGLGIALGQLIGGFLAHSEFLGLSGWRIAFILMALPSFPLLLLLLLWGKLPERGKMDPGHSPEEHPVHLSDVRSIFSVKTNLLVFAQSIPGCVPWGLLFTYVVDYYEKNKGFHVEEANLLVMLFGGFAIMGAFVGGYLGAFFYRLRHEYLPLFCGLTILLGMIPTFIIINYTGKTIAPMFLVAILGGLITPLTGPNVRAILANTNLPEHRGSVFALFNLTDDLGKGLGPFFVGLLLLIFEPEIAYNVAVAFWLISGIIWFFMPSQMVRDEELVTQTLKQR
ncbi:MAG: MFS transporter [Leptospiraceae bacterium]|nr:MFS transporter [Leptospiraceae bacterium]MDW8306665.1 MFS transporter [Leptospiraceae bacterium]